MKRRLVAVAVVVALIVLAAWAELTYQVVPFQRRDVAMPPVGATPERVVAAYVEALDAHDCDTATRLWLDDEETPRMWCGDVAHARIVGTEDVFEESRDRIDVPLTLEVRWRPGKNDGTIEGDPFVWSYILARNPQGAWRIVDDGVA